MGQNISYIITSEKIKVPLGIVHFKESGGIIIPLLIDEDDFEKINSHSKNADNSCDFYEDCTRHLIYEYPTKEIFDFMDDNKIKTFGLISYREILEIPENREPLVFIDDKRIHLESTNSLEAEIHTLLGFDFTFSELIRNEKKYWNYETSKYYYFTELEKMLANNG